jgi:hypothetical protein
MSRLRAIPFPALVPVLALLVVRVPTSAQVVAGNDLRGEWVRVESNNPVADQMRIRVDYHYSSHGFTLVGAALEEVLQQDVHTIIQDYLAVPYSLPSTSRSSRTTVSWSPSCRTSGTASALNNHALQGLGDLLGQIVLRDPPR